MSTLQTTTPSIFRRISGALLGRAEVRPGTLRWGRWWLAENAHHGLDGVDVHPATGSGNAAEVDTRLANGGGSRTTRPAARLMVVFDQLEATIMVIIVKNDEEAAKVAAIVLTNFLEDVDQVLIGQTAGESRNRLDEVHLLRSRIGRLWWRVDHQ